VPDSCAENGGEGSDPVGAPPVAAGRVVDDLCPSSCAGVPARRAHPLASGPPVSQTTRSTGATMLANSAVTRMPARAGHPTARRHQTASSTAITHAASHTNTTPTLVSVPLARLCTSTKGQLTYENQWTTRHVR
jgi:hypothetical protein